jgi:hypothetical protein
MRDYLLDLVQHTYDLGCIDLVKVTGDTDGTTVNGAAEDRSVIVEAKFRAPIAEFVGTFGMPNLNKLKVVLNLQEYKEDAQINVVRQDRDGESQPTGLHFQNKAGDFKNDYRLMTSAIIAEKFKTPKFRGVTWHVEFEPTVASIMRLKMQASANEEELNFKVKLDGTELKFYFGDHSTHAGEFVFQSGVGGSLKRSWSYPVKQFISIMNLTGDKVVKFSDEGAAQIIVDSGIAEYNYILPAQQK